MNRRACTAMALLCLATAPAFADSRSDALAGVSRCGGIVDDRSFLNCVYGAMQPLRAELGLPPAPAAQTALVPPAGAAVASAPQARRAAPPPARNEGMLGSLLGSGKTDVAGLRMTDFAFDRNGLFTVTLNDGEVWRQVSGDTSLAHWHGAAAAYIVTITGGALGSFNLQVKGDPTRFKVSRVR